MKVIKVSDQLLKRLQSESGELQASSLNNFKPREKLHSNYPLRPCLPLTSAAIPKWPGWFSLTHTHSYGVCHEKYILPLAPPHTLLQCVQLVLSYPEPPNPPPTIDRSHLFSNHLRMDGSAPLLWDAEFVRIWSLRFSGNVGTYGCHYFWMEVAGVLQICFCDPERIKSCSIVLSILVQPLDFAALLPMAFARLSAIIALAFATVQVANAGLTRRVTCPSGQVTANAGCCGQICPLFCYYILMSVCSSFPNRRPDSEGPLWWWRVRWRGL